MAVSSRHSREGGNPVSLITNSMNIWTSAVKAKSAVGRGTSKKIELYGIKKLRALILELAVRGLLVPQDPNDEPASELLKKIAAEKAKLVKEGKIKKQKPLPPIGEDEKPFELPAGWAWTRLAKISEANTGFAFKSSEYADTGTFVLRVTNINPDGTINKLDNKYISPEAAKQSYEKFSLNEGDVLLVMVGGSLGKIGVVSNDILPAVLNQNMWKLDRFGGIEIRYFVAGVRYINENQISITKSTHGHLAQGAYMEKLFPLPPLAEQHRIVAKVDELMTLCDQLEQQTEASISAHQTLVQTLLGALTNTSERDGLTAKDNVQDAPESRTAGRPRATGGNTKNAGAIFGTKEAWASIAEHFDTLFTTEWSIDQLKQTILQLAVMGKLVPQDPSDEPASELLKKIAAEKAKLVKEGKIKSRKVQVKNVDNSKTTITSVGWVNCNVNDIALLVTDGTHKTPHYTTKGINFVSAKDVSTGSLKFDDCKYISAEEHLELKKRCNPQVGDILISKSGSIGTVVIVEEMVEFSLFESLALIKFPQKLLNGKFLRYSLQASCLDLNEKHIVGVAVKHLHLNVIRGLRISIPPILEQNRIVAKVDELMTLCDTLKTRINTAQTTQLQLADAMADQALA